MTSTIASKSIYMHKENQVSIIEFFSFLSLKLDYF